GLQGSDTVTLRHEAGVDLGRRPQSRRRGEAEVLDEKLELAGVPLAIGGNSKTGIGAGQYRHAGGARLFPIDAPDLVLALRMVRSALEVSRLVRLREVDRIARVRQGRGNRAARLQHRRNTFLVEVVGVKDQIDPGTGGIEGCLAAAGMRHRLLTEAMDLADHDVGLLLRE